MLTICTLISYSQSSTANMTGEFYLQGVMETASGFKLNADSTFEFFFSYGALDRFGKGTYTIKGHTLVLNSGPRPAKDFKLKTSKRMAGLPGVLVKMVDANPQVVQFVEVNSNRMNSHGEAQIKAKSLDSISLFFQLCPDRASVFPITDKTHNYFEFAFEPWIMDVFFENAVFKIEDDKKITGKHPLLTGQQYVFVKD